MSQIMYSFLATALVLCAQVFTATLGADPTTSQLIAKLLESLTRDSSPKPWHLREPQESSPQPKVKPIPAPPPSPALGGVERPVAWPYPPAPNTLVNSEFPLLERFLKSNGVQTSFQTNQISNNQWNEPERKPTPTSAPIQWDTRKQNSAPALVPQYIEWGVPQKSQASPKPSSQYTEWGAPQKDLGLMPAPLSGIAIPPPLNPEENFHIQHTGRNNPSQQKHFSLETIRMPEPKSENRDKLNVSFIMPPDIKPLSLNFDTGEVQINFGDDKGRRVPIPTEAFQQAGRQYRSKLQLDQIFGSSTPNNGNSQEAPRGVTQPKNVQNDEDDEYIVVRHDMNKYAYDLPKGLSVGTNPQSLSAPQTSAYTAPQTASYSAPQTASYTAPQTASYTSQSSNQPSSSPTQTQTVEKYDVSGQKNLHFVLGRVSG